MAAHARGALELARGDAQAALDSLRRAWRTCQQLEVPYMAARARLLIGLACRALGDEDGGALELDAAEAVTNDHRPVQASIPDVLQHSVPHGGQEGRGDRRLAQLTHDLKEWIET